MQITQIGIIGAGIMGIQLTECFLEHGYDVILKTRSISCKENILTKINKHLSKRHVDKEVSVVDFLHHLKIVDSFIELNSCNVIIESVIEDYQIKKDVLTELWNCIAPGTIVVTNTSALSISRLSESLPGLAGFHFFNPVHKMELVEIVPSTTTSDESIKILKEISSALGKHSIVVTDTPGFLVNRLLLPQINNAIKMFEAGIGSIEDIDLAVKLGLNHSMGPFQLADFIGLDVCLFILDEMYEVSDDPNYRPASVLRKLVADKKLGYKTGCGFYSYKQR